MANKTKPSLVKVSLIPCKSSWAPGLRYRAAPLGSGSTRASRAAFDASSNALPTIPVAGASTGAAGATALTELTIVSTHILTSLTCW